MNETKRFFKVVRENRDYANKLPSTRRFLSAYFTEEELEYGIGVKTVPKIPGSKLFVFDSYCHAAQICRSGQSIYLCFAENPVPAPKRVASDSSNQSDRFQYFWRFFSTERGGAILEDGMDVPYGTFLADSVTLIGKKEEGL